MLLLIDTITAEDEEEKVVKTLIQTHNMTMCAVCANHKITNRLIYKVELLNGTKLYTYQAPEEIYSMAQKITN